MKSPSSLRLGDLEPRVSAICTKYPSISPPDFIREAVRRLCDKVETEGRFELQPLVPPATPKDASRNREVDAEHKEALARGARRRSKGDTR